MDGSKVLASYLPAGVRDALARRAPLAGRPEGAALFADISGFTPLSAAFAAELGPTHGAEELARQLDGVFGALIDQVHRFRGSVSAFSGDAITCWFDRAEGVGAGAVQRAAASALAMQRAAHELPPVATPSGRAFPIAVKLALAAGAARRFVVGDPEVQRLEVLAGHTLDRMAAAAGLAHRGEVVVAEEVATALANRAGLRAWREGAAGQRFAVLESLREQPPEWPWPAAPPLHVEVLRHWLPRAVGERIERGEGAFLASFKPVVALFFGFEGIEYEEDPEAEQQLDALTRRVQRILGERGGHLVDLNTGDKGSHLFAAFGALRAHEDEARRALDAALLLRALPAELPFVTDLRIGVAQSQVYTGAYGCAARRTFGVFGREVNVAARLMEQAAAGEILTTPHIARAAGVHFELERREPVRLKGLPEPVAPHRLVEAREEPAGAGLGTGDGELVGRRAERRVLEEALAALRAGQGGRIVLEGEPGIGKSRLLAHLQARAQQLGVTTWVGASDALRHATSYHPWRGVFEQLFELDPADARASASARAKPVLERLEALGPDSVALAPLLGPVLGLELPESAATERMEGQVRADNTQDLLVRLLRQEAGAAPRLLLLEDLHWFDSPSAALLGLVAREVPSLLTVATRRPPVDRPAAALADALELAGARRLPLERLEPDEVEALLRRTLEVASLPHPVLALIERKAEGSPFFSRELAFALRDAGHVVIADGTCQVAPGAGDLTDLDFPDTIQGVIASRIDALTTGQQLAAKVASVIGRRFDERILRDVHPVAEDRPQLAESLEALERAHLTLRAEDTREPGYVFQHALTQEVAYGLLLHSQRQVLHERVANWYERQYADDLSPHYPVLAHHLGRAARGREREAALFGRALDYLERAGDQALRGYSNLEAVRFFQQAVALDESAPVGVADAEPGATGLRRAAWFGGLARAYLALSKFEDCQRATYRALALLDHPVPERAGALALSSLGQLIRQVRTRVTRRPVGDPGLEQAERRRLNEVEELLRILAKSLYHENDSLRMLYANLHSLNLSERLASPAELALVYSHGLLSLGVFQAHGWARAYGRWAQDAARRSGNAGRLVTVLVNHGVYYVGRGEWEAARSALEEGRAVAGELGDDSQWCECTALLADVALFQGELALSSRLYAEVLATADRRGMRVHMSWSMRPRVVEALRQGRPARAAELLEESRRLWGAVPDRLVQIDALGLLALARWRMGQSETAMEAVREAQALIPSVSPPVAYPRLLGYAAIAEVCLDAWEAALARRAGRRERRVLERRARLACRHLDGYQRAFRLGRPAARIHGGRYSWLRGRRRRARSQWREGLEASDTLGMAYERATARRYLGRFGEGGAERCCSRLADAEREFAALGASHERERVRADLESAREEGRPA